MTKEDIDKKTIQSPAGLPITPDCKIIIGLIGLIILFIFCYYQPVSEKMVCNEDYICTVEHKFIGGIKFNKKFELNNNSYIRERVYTKYNFESKSYSKSKRSYKLYTILVDKNLKEHSPFIYYTYSTIYSWKKDELLNKFSKERQKFSDYINNPSKGYTLESDASYGMIVFIVGFIIFAYIYNFIENLFKKRIRRG